MLEIFKFVFEVNFFIFPISAGWLTYRKLRGKPASRPLRMMISSLVMMFLSYIGVFVNSPPEVRHEVISNVERIFGE